MDQNVIENLKCQYRKLLLREIVTKMDKDKESFRPNLFHAMRYLKTAWDNVHSATIRNAFIQARFVFDDEVFFLSQCMIF